jgi:hypothetical protein
MKWEYDKLTSAPVIHHVARDTTALPVTIPQLNTVIHVQTLYNTVLRGSNCSPIRLRRRAAANCGVGVGILKAHGSQRVLAPQQQVLYHHAGRYKPGLLRALITAAHVPYRTKTLLCIPASHKRATFFIYLLCYSGGNNTYYNESMPFQCDVVASYAGCRPVLKYTQMVMTDWLVSRQSI